MPALAAAQAGAAATEDAPGGAAPVKVTIYWGADCPHCFDERTFLAGLEGKYPSLVIEEYEVWEHPDNLAQLRAKAAEMGFDATGTPITIMGDQHWIGFTSNTAREIEAAVVAALEGRAPDVTVRSAVVEMPLVGEIDLGSSSLLMAAIVIGFVDGVNPCSLWVLSVLLAIVLHSGSRGRVLVVGTTFLLVTTAMYGLYMTGLYSALDYVGQLKWIRLVVGVVALVFGLIHLKDYFWFKEGISLSIDDKRKPGLYKQMRDVARADRSVPAVLGGTVVLAVGVSLLETPCTAGLPLLWTSLLASQGVALATAMALFGVYMFVFLLDELALFVAAVITLRAARVQEEHGRVLKLVSGAVMVTLAVSMIVLPSALESVLGTVQVFGVAAAVVAVVLALSWMKTSFTAR